MQDQIFQVKIRKMQIVLPVEFDDDRFDPFQIYMI